MLAVQPCCHTATRAQAAASRTLPTSQVNAPPCLRTSTHILQQSARHCIATHHNRVCARFPLNPSQVLSRREVHLAGSVLREGKALLVAANKMDALNKQERTTYMKVH